MMLRIKKFIPRDTQLKLHIEVQISSRVLSSHEQFQQVKHTCCGDDSTFLTVGTIEDYRGNKQYGILRHGA